MESRTELRDAEASRETRQSRQLLPSGKPPLITGDSILVTISILLYTMSVEPCNMASLHLKAMTSHEAILNNDAAQASPSQVQPPGGKTAKKKALYII